MNLSEIQDLIKFVSKSGVTEVEIQQKEFKIIIKAEPPVKKKGSQELLSSQLPMQVALPAQTLPVAAAQPATQQQATTAPPPATKADDNANNVVIKSPMIGTFYRSPGPDKASFVNVGDEIKPGKVICIIEAMKLFNEIEAEVSGRIVKVLVDDSSPVEYDQPLFLIEPA
jgi:acetyl-CoA carboxylase biotin carboxyl carrier protein